MVIRLLHKSFLVLDQNRSMAIPASREGPSSTQDFTELPGAQKLCSHSQDAAEILSLLPCKVLPGFTAARRTGENVELHGFRKCSKKPG